MEIVDLVGYLAPVVLLLSFLMKDINRLRIVNSVGCLLFVTWGFMLPSTAWPVIIANSAIVFINLYQLYKSKAA